MYWYEDEVKRLEEQNPAMGYTPETIFYGSSSIRLWDSLYSDFSELKPVNLGFGGSTLAACVWFFDRIMIKYKPERIVFYAGDNDLGDGRNPEEVFIFFQELVAKSLERFGQIPCYFVSLKPSITRWLMADNFRHTNSLIEAEIERINANWHFVDVFNPMLTLEGLPKKEYFVEDGLHLSKAAYQLWTELIKSAIAVNG